MSVVALAVGDFVLLCCAVSEEVVRVVFQLGQNGSTALLLACAQGYLDMARWLVANASSDARSERDDVSCRGSCCRRCVCSRYPFLRRCFVRGIMF
jgi:hypothetical protein